MKKVGLTGGIGSGKTTVARIFEALGTPTYNADVRAKKLMRKNKEIRIAIVNLLGPNSYYTNGYPNRKHIATLVFNDKALLKKLNAIVHPAVKLDLKNWFEEQNKAKYSIYESALILDHHKEADFDIIISVIAPTDLRIERIMKRDRSEIKDIEARLNNQISDKERIKRSDFIINNGLQDSLEEQVLEIHNKLNDSSDNHRNL